MVGRSEDLIDVAGRKLKRLGGASRSRAKGHGRRSVFGGDEGMGMNDSTAWAMKRDERGWNPCSRSVSRWHVQSLVRRLRKWLGGWADRKVPAASGC